MATQWFACHLHVALVDIEHGRGLGVQRQLDEKNLQHDRARGQAHLSLLSETHEQDLVTALSKYPEVVQQAAISHEPHQLAHYLRELANEFHTYYNAHQFLVDSEPLRNARLNLIQAVRQVIANGLGLLGVSAPESM